MFEQLKQITDKIYFWENNQEFFKISEFEKDNDSNGHIEFLYTASNLRAKNFRIENCGYNKVKMISGKITPVIVTTTAAIVVLFSTQLYTLK